MGSCVIMAREEVVTMDVRTKLEAPGLAVIETCPDCHGRAGGCRECDGHGRILWRCCPRCGNPAFDFVNGRSEAGGMRCANGCGASWQSDYPGWAIQHL